MILDLVEDKNPKDNIDCTPLHDAANNGHVEIVKMIFDVVEDKNPTDRYGRTPFSFAQSIGHTNICKLIDESYPNHPIITLD